MLLLLKKITRLIYNYVNFFSKKMFSFSGKIICNIFLHFKKVEATNNQLMVSGHSKHNIAINNLKYPFNIPWQKRYRFC